MSDGDASSSLLAVEEEWMSVDSDELADHVAGEWMSIDLGSILPNKMDRYDDCTSKSYCCSCTEIVGGKFDCGSLQCHELTAESCDVSEFLVIAISCSPVTNHPDCPTSSPYGYAAKDVTGGDILLCSTLSSLFA